MKTRVRRILVLLLFVVSALILVWGIWPFDAGTRTVQIYPQDMRLPEGPETTTIKLIPESRALTLEWPAVLRTGERGGIRLGLELTQGGEATATPDTTSGQAPGESLPVEDVFDSHYVIAEARLEIADMAYAPVGQISEGLFPGRPVYFVWQVRPDEPGDYQGTVWLHLSYVPIDGGPESRAVLSAQRIDIQAVQLLWFGGTAARVVGSVGVIVALVAGLDDLLPWIMERRRKRNQG
jgi:hypothetical protein